MEAAAAHGRDTPEWAAAALAGGLGAPAEALARAPPGSLAAGPVASASGGRLWDTADIQVCVCVV